MRLDNRWGGHESPTHTVGLLNIRATVFRTLNESVMMLFTTHCGREQAPGHSEMDHTVKERTPGPLNGYSSPADLIMRRVWLRRAR